mmetsp:Transcript_2590/g.8852  ORF Transcript_2590/g.8852 Transcript_2590/m.8852 type:complete len:310 (+) Transcript_2590:1456-2385(+)
MAMGGHLRRTKGRKLSREQVAPGRGSRELFWCVCHVQHGVRGWCYCSLDGEQQVGFLEAAKRVGWDVKGYGTEGAEAPAPSPKTPALDQLLPVFAPSRLGSATLSALLTERGRAALKRCRHSGGRPLGSGRAGEGARRSLDADFARSLGGAGRSESEEGSAWPEDEVRQADGDRRREALPRLTPPPLPFSSPTHDHDVPVRRAQEASACEGSERSEGGSSDEEEEVECMPWHFWMCSGCGRRLPEGHMNCAGKVLRRFDLASKYGPCVGITRMERWIRARDLGLDPPASVCDILARSGNRDVTDRALWG